MTWISSLSIGALIVVPPFLIASLMKKRDSSVNIKILITVGVGAFLVSSIIKLFLIATFASESSAEGVDLHYFSRIIRGMFSCLLLFIDFAIYSVLFKMVGQSINDVKLSHDSRLFHFVIGWSLAECVFKYIVPLVKHARSMEFSPSLLLGGLESNINLLKYFVIVLSAYCYFHKKNYRNQKSGNFRGTVLATLITAVMFPVLTTLLNGWMALIIQAPVYLFLGKFALGSFKNYQSL